MKEYSILIVGINCYLGHIREFATHLKKKNPQVDISLAISPASEEGLAELMDCASQIFTYKSFNRKSLPASIASRLNRISCYLMLSKLSLRKHFDIIDIHFATPFIKPFMPLFRKMSRRLVISPWGSDVLRVDNKDSIAILRTIYAQADFVTIGKDSQIGHCLIETFKVSPDKMVRLGWGGDFFDFIQEHSESVSTEEAKERFGLKNRYVITCGYNTMEAQRHKEIIHAISCVRQYLPANLTVLIICTYVFFNSGKATIKKSYIEALKDQCKNYGLDCVVVEGHLNMSDLLKLRMATDIFVHIQETDAGSRSVMEYVACNKKLVHGAWVKYNYLDTYKPSCFFPVDSMDQLGSRILDAYHSKTEDLPSEVKKHIYERGWSHKMGLWNSFFESLVS